MSDSSSCVDVKVNDSINNNLKLDNNGDDKKDSCECSKICDELVRLELDHVKENLQHPILDHQQEEDEDVIKMKKKYGGLLRKKPSLISKDHERAFFDSADWALRKQGASDRAKGGSLEVLLPKLEPTPHHQLQSKRLAYASTSTDDEFNHECTSDAAKLDGDDHVDELIPNKN